MFFRMFFCVVIAAMSLAACAPQETAEPEEIVLSTRADSVAMRAYEAVGGPAVWNTIRYLRFDFANEAGGDARMVARHLGDRFTGDYRVEWAQGPDTTVVVLMNVNDRHGHAYVNTVEADTAFADALVDRAYRRYINDSYWMLVPVKLFDAGVTRTYVADSSSAAFDVIKLSFQDVGLTPGDQYWLWVDTQDGMVRRFAFLLQGWGDRPPSTYEWTRYLEFETPQGVAKISARKDAAGRDFSMLTLANLPTTDQSEYFTNPARALE